MEERSERDSRETKGADSSWTRFLRAPIAAWVVAVAVAGTLLSVYGFDETSGDSRFYNRLVVELSDQPMRQWVAPKWGDNRHGPSPESYIQDHLVGSLVLGLLLTKCGVPAHDALTIVQMICQILAIYVLAILALRFVKPVHAHALLWGLQIIPIFIARGIRANHEQAVLLFTFLGMYAAVRMAGSYKWAAVLAVGINAVFLINGAFAALVPLLAVPAYLLALEGPGWRRRVKGVLLIGAASLSVVLTAVAYEYWFRSVTGLEFFREYWRIQIMERSVLVEAELAPLLQKLANAWYYGGRLFVYSAPWSLTAICLVAFGRFFEGGRWMPPVEGNREPARRLMRILAAGAATYVAVFVCFDRLASRYVVPAFFLGAAFFFLYTVERWMPARKLAEIVDRCGVHRVAAGLWLVRFLIHFFIRK